MISAFVLKDKEKDAKEVMKKKPLFSHFSISFSWKNCFDVIQYKVPTTSGGN